MKKSVLFTTVVAVAGLAQAAVINFDSKDTGVNGYYNPGGVGDSSWSDGGATFSMPQPYAGTYWEGFTYSDVNDTETTGYLNQYTVYGDGKDYSDNGVYAISYAAASSGFGSVPEISFASAQTVNGLYVNNTTYAALDMISGSVFSKAFSTNDWFTLTIEGKNGGGVSQGTVDFDLADFTGYVEGDNKENYMVTDWAWVNLALLGSDVSSLTFSLSSSDTGAGGMNTPAYFAIDNVDAIPEPGTIGLMLLSFGGMTWFRRRFQR